MATDTVEIQIDEKWLKEQILKEANVHLCSKNTWGVTITSAEKWYTRIWLLLSNPFRYLFTGRVRY